ncbi:MAG: imidazole glycerol phosphate synthase subunit HisH [Alphaproteobacteria bacterium]|nr:imidazole glycerol phosphate synthase subunit HisH [Alphaproteobacteria bacterium]
MNAAKVLLVDYGVGNLLSVSRALQACGGAVEQTGDPQRILAAARLVLPGVGAFGSCMDALARQGLVEPLRAYARSARTLLGICVGMQMLFETGEEFGRHEGLGLLPGTVGAISPLTEAGQRRKIPHIGWSALHPPGGQAAWEGGVLADTTPGQSVYFVHSFAAYPSRPEDVLAVTDYEGCRIAAVVGHERIVGCQFHPEKSGPVGLAMLRRFLSL